MRFGRIERVRRVGEDVPEGLHLDRNGRGLRGCVGRLVHAEEVGERAANACPPLFLGIGIGGTFDLAARQAKKALFNMPGDSELELDLLGRINSLGIGPMGLGGDTTALGVRIEKASCHTASLPVAINFQCWANRCASAVVR